MAARALRLAVLVVAVAYLAIAVPVALRNAWLRLRLAARTAGLGEEAVRERVFGRRYDAAIERIRAAIPENEPYLITEQQEYALAWVRFDLLPRPAIDVRPAGWRPRTCEQAAIRWLVVAAGGGHPPLLVERPAAVPPGCPPPPWLPAAPPRPAR
jgi:hypothetical protein